MPDSVWHFHGRVEKTAKDVIVYQEMIDEIKEIMRAARENVAYQVNNELISAYWNIGRVIVEHEQDSNERAGYGRETMRQISKQLSQELGKGFSLSNVYNMRQFYLDYPKFQSLTGKLTWTHYCELMSISDKDNVSAEYALGGLSNNIFASTYTYVIPDKEKLIAQVGAVLKQWEDNE